MFPLHSLILIFFKAFSHLLPQFTSCSSMKGRSDFGEVLSERPPLAEQVLCDRHSSSYVLPTPPWEVGIIPIQ